MVLPGLLSACFPPVHGSEVTWSSVFGSLPPQHSPHDVGYGTHLSARCGEYCTDEEGQPQMTEHQQHEQKGKRPQWRTPERSILKQVEQDDPHKRYCGDYLRAHAPTTRERDIDD